MLTYDSHTNTLTAQRIPIDTKDIHVTILNAVQESYNHFKNVDVIEVIEDVVARYFTRADKDHEYKVKAKVQGLFTYSTDNMDSVPEKHYPVTVTFYRRRANSDDQYQKLNIRSYEIFQIPYMDEFGKFTYNHSYKTCVSKLESANDVSYDNEKKSINISIPKAKITISPTKTHLTITATNRFGERTSINLDQLAQAFLYEAGDDTSIYDCSVSNVTKAFLSLQQYTTPEGLSGHNNTDLFDYIRALRSNQYDLGNTREALNKYLSMENAIGFPLSRPVVNKETGEIVLDKGHIFTRSDVATVYKSRNNIVYVTDLNFTHGYRISEPLILSGLPRGTKLYTFLKKHIAKYPKYIDQSVLNQDVLSEDLIFTKPQEGEDVTQFYFARSIINKDTILSKDMVDFIMFLNQCGMYNKSYIHCHTKNSKKPEYMSFEREVVGNYMIRRGDITPNADIYEQNMGVDDWIYMFNAAEIPVGNDVNYVNQDNAALGHLTGHDLHAIYVDMCYMKQTGKVMLLDRDDSFLKRVLLVGDLFIDAIQRRAATYFTKAKVNTILKELNGTKLSNHGFTHSVMSYLIDNGNMSTTDSVNVSAEISQVSHVVTNVSKHGVKDAQRRLAIPFYGRICPFETPAGQKLGLVNSMAIGTRVNKETGMLEAPFRRIIKTGNKLSIFEKIYYLDPKQMIHHRFVDLFKLKFNPDGSIDENSECLALVPNPEPYGDPFVFVTVSGDDLAPQSIHINNKPVMSYCYVNVIPEQFISTTACLIPFCSSDDATRITYGLSQIKQAIYLQETEKPLVTTFMYDKIFEFNTEEHITAPITGSVTKITTDFIFVHGVTRARFTNMANIDFSTMYESHPQVTVGESISHDTVVTNLTLATDKYNDRLVDGVLPVRSGHAGIVRAIHGDYIDIEETVSVDIYSEKAINGKTPTQIILRCNEGDSVEAGDTLAIRRVYPQPFITKSPVSGRVKDVKKNSILIDTNVYKVESPYDGEVVEIDYGRSGTTFDPSKPEERNAIASIRIKHATKTGFRTDRVSLDRITYDELDPGYFMQDLHVSKVADAPADKKHKSTPHVIVRVGQKVSKGEIIAEKFDNTGFNPDMFLFDPRDNANLDMTKRKNLVIPFNDHRIMGNSALFTNIHVTKGEDIVQGQVLADTNVSHSSTYTPSRNALVGYIPMGFNYEDGVVVSEKASIEYTSVSSHTLKRAINPNLKNPIVYNTEGFGYCFDGDPCATIRSKDEKNGTLEEQDLCASDKANGIVYGSRVISENSGAKIAKVNMLGFNKLGRGDKMSGRHGNKGVVSCVLPNSQAPQLKNGLTLDIILNPHGVPSRMNLGQIWEIHAGLIAKVLDIYINSDPYNGASPEEITDLMHATWYIANTDESVKSILSKLDCANAVLSDDLIQHIEDRREEIKSMWGGVFNKNGTAELYDPVTDSFFNTPVVIGYSYMLKLKQVGQDKRDQRSGPLEERYSMTASQPIKEESVDSHNGQRAGEMELMGLASYGAVNLLDESLNEKSDNLGRSTNLHAEALGLDIDQLTGSNAQSRSVDNLYSYIEVLGLRMVAGEDPNAIREDERRIYTPSQNLSRVRYDLPYYIKMKENAKATDASYQLTRTSLTNIPRTD